MHDLTAWARRLEDDAEAAGHDARELAARCRALAGGVRVDRRRWRAVEWTGRVVLAGAVLAGLFVVDRSFATALTQERSQRDLAAALEARLAAEPEAEAPAEPVPVAAPPAGEALARLEVPAIGLDQVVVEGVAAEQLARGPGHYPGTAMPGEEGNVGIAGHRVTHGGPFRRLDELRAGDEIVLTGVAGRFTYHVRGQRVVVPEEVRVLDPSPAGRLTLTTCNPEWSARERLVVVADLVGVGIPPPAYADVGRAVLAGSVSDTPPDGGPPVVAWLGVAVAGVAVSVGARRRWRLVVWPAAAVPTLVALHFLFDGVERSLAG